MSPEKRAPATVITTLKELEELANLLKRETHVCIDMESDSFYVYHEKVCLLQLSAGAQDFIIDPLSVKDLSPLGPLFKNAGKEKVFHAGEYDIICLKRDFGFTIRNIFDTMVAARTLGASRLGLAPLLEQYLGVKISKKLQRANWGKRPLTYEHLEYARNDTCYLMRLRELLTKELNQKGLLRDAQDEFLRLEKIEPIVRKFEPDAFWHLHGARELTPQKRSVLKQLYVYREQTAATLDRAPFRVLPEQLLVRMAEACPKTLDALQKVKGMTSYLFRRFSKELLQQIDEGKSAPPIDRPPQRTRRNPWDADTMRRYEALRQWRKEVADKRGVNPVVILPTDVVRQLAKAPAETPEGDAWLSSISDYKKGLYGKDLMEILKRPLPPRKRRRRSRKGRTANISPENNI